MADKMAIWLARELKTRGWSIRELSRRSGVSHPVISDMINLDHHPKVRVYAAIAQAFGIEPRIIFEIAGIEKPEPDSNTPNAQALLAYFSDLMPDHQSDVIEHAKALYALERADRPYNVSNTGPQPQPVEPG